MDESLLREVVVTRSDDRGYGLTVSGESPVMVQDVKEGGPACLAGVQVGDCIMKVNGTPVSKFNHREVVQIIKSSHSVRLTVCAGGSLPVAAAAADSQAAGDAASGGLSASVLLRHHPKDKQHNKITAPLPVNNQLQNQLDVNRHKMLSKMLDTQLKTRESILVELEKKPPKALQKTLEKELDTINSLVSTIQTKLKAMETENPLSQLHSSSSSSRRSPAVSRTSLPFVASHSTSFHPYLPTLQQQLLLGPQPQKYLQGSQHHVRSHFAPDSHMPPPLPPQSRSQHNLSQHHHPQHQNKFLHRNPKQKHTRSASDIPPPLPARNRALLTQISEPNMVPISPVSIPNLSFFDSSNVNSNLSNADGGVKLNSSDGNANITLGDGVPACGGSSSSSSNFPQSDNLNAAHSSGAQTATKGSTTSHDLLSCSSVTSASSSFNPSSKASKSSSFKTPKGSTSLSASPSCVSTMSAPPNLCPPPLPPRPPNMGGSAREAQPLGGLHSITSESSNNSSSSSSSGGSRPPSQHHRAKSSPETITANPQARHEAFSGHLSGSDSMGDLASIHSSNSNNSNRSSSRVASALLEDDPPPGTPPPPYANNNIHNTNNNSSNATAVTATEEPDDVDCANNVSSQAASAGLFASVSSGGGVAGGDHGGGAVNSADDEEQDDDDDENYSTIPDELTTSMLGAMEGSTTWAQKAIQSMEDEDCSDSEMMYGDHGPFQSLSKLLVHPAYLAVFMNFIISNCSPATAFFYMITDLYKEGAAKEMKKWAYEIHSSFLLPSAPMPVGCTIDDAVLNEIDETLRHDLDKEETLRKVFLKVRQRAREVLNEQLADFRSKRMAGLGNIFGPPDAQLMESRQNKNKEMSIIEFVLVPFLESVSDEWNHNDQSLIMASSLATLLWKWFNVRSPKAMALIDRCPLYVNRDRPLRSKFFKANKKQLVREHCFNQMTYYSVTYCNHCQDVIWGVAPQGYQCANCEMNIHKTCAKLVEELCIGQVRKKAPRDKKLHSFLGKIIPEDRETKRKSSQLGSNFPMDKRRGTNEDDLVADLFSHLPDAQPDSLLAGADKSSNSTTPGGSSTSGSGHQHLGGRDPSVSRRSDSIPGASFPSNHTCDTDDGTGIRDLLHDDDASDTTGLDMAAALPDAPSSGKPNLQKKKSGNPINRSESYKDKHQRKRIREDRRKHSDPNIPTSKSGDVDVDSGLKDNDSGSSSNSSLSYSLDSPSPEQVSGRDALQLLCPQLNNDSDVEAEADLPDWSANVPADQLAGLPSRERKRQDTINELFHTEQTHVRMLKVMSSLFYNPLLSSGLLTDEQLNLLFPNLNTMLEIHSSFNKAMKKRRREQPLVQTIGDILTSMFEGLQGETFEHEAAVFVRSQSIGLEGLKLSKKRDQKLATFLQERENHPYCRRLQLKDMLPAGFQRLSKYPLLLESLLGYTDLEKYPDEYEQINRCLIRAKEILASVNAAVREEENHQRLIEIQRRLDQSNMAKNKHGHVSGVKGNLDLTKHRLIYEGPLTWRLSKNQKNLDLHVLVLEQFIVLLQKDSDKYILKNYSLNKASMKEDSSHSPVIKFGPQLLYRAVATDSCAFFIVTTQCGPAQIYELVTSSPNDRKIWFRHFQETQASVNDNSKDGGRGNRRAQQPSSSQPQDHDPDTQPQQDRDGVEDSLDDSEAQDSGEGPTTPGTSANNNNNATDSPQDSFAKKTDSNDVSASNSTATGAGTSAGRAGGGSARRLQEVQIIQIVEDTPLISPSEVTVSQGVVLSAQPVLTPIEHLRRKDLKIKQALKEKQHIIADILDIPREHFGTLGDMASEPGSGPKEPRELVLAAIYQANCLQETLNESLTIRESDIVAAKAGGAESANKLSSSLLPLYPAPMNKLMSIAGSLSHQLNALLNLVSERDDERDRMRKELVASRERMHQLHLSQSPGGASVSSHSSTTPTNSRPNSMVSQTSTPAPDIRDDSETISADERLSTSITQEDLPELIAREAQDECEGSVDGSTPQPGSEAPPSEDETFPEGSREEGSDHEQLQHHPPTT